MSSPWYIKITLNSTQIVFQGMLSLSRIIYNSLNCVVMNYSHFISEVSPVNNPDPLSREIWAACVGCWWQPPPQITVWTKVCSHKWEYNPFSHRLSNFRSHPGVFFFSGKNQQHGLIHDLKQKRRAKYRVKRSLLLMRDLPSVRAHTISSDKTMTYGDFMAAERWLILSLCTAHA